jgi:hypothetical protein
MPPPRGTQELGDLHPPCWTYNPGKFPDYSLWRVHEKSYVPVRIRELIALMYSYSQAGTPGAKAMDHTCQSDVPSKLACFLMGTTNPPLPNVLLALIWSFARTISDEEGLELIYNACGGAGWFYKRRWLSAWPIEDVRLPSGHSWYGVREVTGRRVSRLRLEHNRLTGAFPGRALALLTGLRELRLEYNSLTGQMPQELSLLVGLEYLRLNHNHFTGKIPYLRDLGNLHNLHLYGNPALELPPGAESHTHSLSRSGVEEIISLCSTTADYWLV